MVERKGDSMKKTILLLLATILLCGMLACDPGIPAEKTEATPAPSEPVQPAAPAQTDEPVFLEELARPLSFSEDADTCWNAPDYAFILSVLSDGTASVFTRTALLWLTEDGDSFRVETRMYRTPFDEEPAYRFPAGELRFFTDGNRVKVEVLSDPLGVLSHAQADGRLLTKNGTSWKYAQNRSEVPQEPNTKWYTRFEMTEQNNARLHLTVGNDASFTGTLSLPDGTKKDVALLGCWSSFALVEERDGAAELLFYGERTNWRDPKDWYPPRMNLVRFDLDALYDPLGLCSTENFDLVRAEEFDNVYAEHGALEALRYMPGVNLDTVKNTLTRDGWTDRTAQIETLDPLLDGWFAWLTKDGKTLWIYYEPDFTPYGDEDYPSAYVLYDADGTVLDWSGSRPIDHAIADAFTLQPGAYFGDLISNGTVGMDVAEDDYAYFTDDGRIAVETLWHEGGDGDLDFQIIRLLP